MKETVIFAAGCSWGVQYYFDQVPGVLETEVGYTGGKTDNPTYQQVCGHGTDHAEAVKIAFDPQRVSYTTLLKHFFRLHDPTQLNRQGQDVGNQYRSVIFYANDKQRQTAQKVINQLNKEEFAGKIITGLESAPTYSRGPDRSIGADKWWPAEDYHQKFTERTGRGMCHVGYAPL